MLLVKLLILEIGDCSLLVSCAQRTRERSPIHGVFVQSNTRVLQNHHLEVKNWNRLWIELLALGVEMS